MRSGRGSCFLGYVLKIHLFREPHRKKNWPHSQISPDSLRIEGALFGQLHKGGGEWGLKWVSTDFVCRSPERMGRGREKPRKCEVVIWYDSNSVGKMQNVSGGLNEPLRASAP